MKISAVEMSLSNNKIDKIYSEKNVTNPNVSQTLATDTSSTLKSMDLMSRNNIIFGQSNLLNIGRKKKVDKRLLEVLGALLGASKLPEIISETKKQESDKYQADGIIFTQAFKNANVPDETIDKLKTLRSVLQEGESLIFDINKMDSSRNVITFLEKGGIAVRVGSDQFIYNRNGYQYDKKEKFFTGLDVNRSMLEEQLKAYQKGNCDCVMKDDILKTDEATNQSFSAKMTNYDQEKLISIINGNPKAQKLSKIAIELFDIGYKDMATKIFMEIYMEYSK